MRLGITDGQELATLLFYSTQTIYNYKAAIRKRAKDLFTCCMVTLPMYGLYELSILIVRRVER
jgi:Sec-independent protein secretion pathway component TatC